MTRRRRAGSWDQFRELLAAGPDDPRWESLRRRCEGVIRSMVLWRVWLRHRVGPAAAVEDIAQEVMLRLVVRGRQGLPRAPSGCRESFDGYMRRIAEHLIVDEFRRLGARGGSNLRLVTVDPRRFETGLRRGDEPGDGFFEPEWPAIHRETLAIIRRTLDGMTRDPRQQHLNRHLFQLYFLDGISMAQIARLRSVPLSASSVSRRLRAIRSALRKVFPSAPKPRRSGEKSERSGRRTTVRRRVRAREP